MNILPQTFQGVIDKISKFTNKYKELKKPSVNKRGPRSRDTFQNMYDQLDHGHICHGPRCSKFHQNKIWFRVRSRRNVLPGQLCS